MIDPVIGSQHPDNVLAAVWQTSRGTRFTDRAAQNTRCTRHRLYAAQAVGRRPGTRFHAGCYLGNHTARRHVVDQRRRSLLVGRHLRHQWRLDGGA